MKKYNLSAIMKRAWELVKKMGMSISSGLKKAWEEAKHIEETIEEKLIRLGFKVWEKDEKRRIYIDYAKYLDVVESDTNEAFCFTVNGICVDNWTRFKRKYIMQNILTGYCKLYYDLIENKWGMKTAPYAEKILATVIDKIMVA